MMTLCGMVLDKRIETDVNNIEYAYCTVGVPRYSGVDDIIYVRYKTSDDINLEVGKRFFITGNLRNYSQPTEYPRYRIEVFARKTVEVTDEEEYKGLNEYDQVVTVLRKADKVRVTPGGTKVLDVSFLVRRKSGVVDKIPAVVWGSASVAFWSQVEVNSEIRVKGRLQSRNYDKVLETGETLSVCINEMSVSSWESINKEDK